MKAGQAITILTIDDSVVVYRNISSLFSENKKVLWLGHAFSLAEAYSKIRDKIPQLVILDIQLREETSFILLDYLTTSFPETTVVMFTNLSSEPYRKKCQVLGAKYFLDKSTEFERLPQILDEMLYKKTSAKDNLSC